MSKLYINHSVSHSNSVQERLRGFSISILPNATVSIQATGKKKLFLIKPRLMNTEHCCNTDNRTASSVQCTNHCFLTSAIYIFQLLTEYSSNSLKMTLCKHYSILYLGINLSD